MLTHPRIWTLIALLSVAMLFAFAWERNERVAAPDQRTANTTISQSNTNVSAVPDANVNVGANANVITGPTNTSINPPPVEPFLNTNTAPPPTNQNTNTASLTVTVAEVTTDPERYDGRSVCLTGPYQQSFEFAAFGGGTRVDADGNRQIIEPYVWNDAGDAGFKLDCQPPAGDRPVCVGTATACGIFKYSPNAGFGHVGAYRYILTSR